MTVRLYRDDPYLLEFTAAVTARREHEGRPAVVLDRTAFYAESGGQPWDTGSLSGVPVEAVVEVGGEVLHVLGGPLATDEVAGRVDSERRRDHREQHHGQHLLSRAFVDIARAKTTSFHLGRDVSTIDLDRAVSEDQIAAAETRTNEIVWGARKVGVHTVSRAEAVALGVAVPPEAGDEVRLVEAEGFDLQPCGGTHPRNTAEVGVVLVVGTERHKGGTRVRFLCGHRALLAFRERRATADRLAAIFSSPIAALPEAAERVMAQVVELTHRSRDLLERALDAEARRLLASATGPEPVVVAVYDGWPAADLRVLATRLVTLGRCVALLGARSDRAYVTLAQTEGLGHDLAGLLHRALRELGGKGGGRGNLVQGAGEETEALEPVLEAIGAGLRSLAPEA